MALMHAAQLHLLGEQREDGGGCTGGGDNEQPTCQSTTSPSRLFSCWPSHSKMSSWRVQILPNCEASHGTPADGQSSDVRACQRKPPAGLQRSATVYFSLPI